MSSHTSRRRRLELRHTDDPALNTASLGCSVCAFLKQCGGLAVRSSAFDCLTDCCGTPDSCDQVCIRNVDFVKRIREVEGVDFGSVPRAVPRALPTLPHCIPILYRRVKSDLRLPFDAIAISLYQLIDRHSMACRFESAASLRRHFGVSDSTQVFLDGVATDRPLERWWSLGRSARERIIGEFLSVGVSAASTPNFSVFSAVPRWDNLHSMKRILICWEESVSAGMPTALHVNARTTTDWMRWTEFVSASPEVTALAFEFATGAGGARRLPFHVEELTHLADRVGRPLTLLCRGGHSSLERLRKSFEHVVFLDSASYMKSAKRFRAHISERNQISWKPDPERPADISELLLHNHRVKVAVTEPAMK